mgnify:CR=1 FL=1
MLQFVADDHWSVDNPNPNAAYPRLTKDSNGNKRSVFYLLVKECSFLEIKKCGDRLYL